jgi:hypothetical protein
MKSSDIATVTMTIGLAGYAVIMISSNLYHKWKKRSSFTITAMGNKNIIKNSALVNIANSIGLFFILSISTVIVAANINNPNIYIQLFIIYTICLVIALSNFYWRKKFSIIIDKELKEISVKGEVFSLTEFNEFEISDRKSWLSDDLDSYGLYIKNANNDFKLVYGYSVYKDIKKLKEQIESKLNGNL